MRSLQEGNNSDIKDLFRGQKEEKWLLIAKRLRRVFSVKGTFYNLIMELYIYIWGTIYTVVVWHH